MRRSDAPPLQDGIGQSLWGDLLFTIRFLRCRRHLINWRQPDGNDRSRYGPGSLVDRFGDDLYAAADYDRRQWVVTERWWHGWPDPPRFAVFAFSGDGNVWLAHDFHMWPSCWSIDRRVGTTTHQMN